MSGPAVRGWIAAAGTLLVCAGCGFKGPLYLPERTGTVITHPGQRAPSPEAQTPQTPNAKQKDKIPPSPPPPSSLPPPPQ
jgi:predicted small lipoprotein YifL